MRPTGITVLQENEVITFILGVGAVAFVAFNYRSLRRITGFHFLLAALIISFCSWTATNLEAFFAESFFNTFEHIGYALSSVAVALWCLRVFLHREGDR